jgi:uncharacterized protein
MTMPRTRHDQTGNGNGRTKSPAAGNDLRPSHNGGGDTGQHYDCPKCPAYCCSYAKIIVEKRDVEGLARNFGIPFEDALQRFTKIVDGEQVLRHKKDEIYGSVCIFLDKEERRCTVYDARPGVCREYPDRACCGYYEFLKWERTHQGNVEFVPLRKT